MATAQAPNTDELTQVKSRVVQRAMAAELRKDDLTMKRNYLAAAHLELLLADDYREAGREDLAIRSCVGAASCFWLGGNFSEGRQLFAELILAHPARTAEFQELLAELESDHPDPSRN